ncbi:MAG: restriction endonuclease subunit S [Limnochordia bacterium]
MPLVRIRDVLQGRTATFYSGEYDETYIVHRGDLLVGMDGDFHCAYWQGPPALLNQRVCKVTVDELLYDKRFLRYVLPGYLNAINDHTSAVTVKHLSSRTMASIPLPVPPLVEQRAIVAKIEELFSELDKGIEQLQTVKQQLNQYRQAVLKAAFEGKLTAEWRAEQQAAGNLPDADELLEQIKKEREERYQQQLQEWKQAVVEWEEAGGRESGRKKPRRACGPRVNLTVDRRGNGRPGRTSTELGLVSTVGYLCA